MRKYGPSCEEVFLPAAKKMAKATDEELVDIQQLDNWAQLAFEGTKKLNRIQSAVFETAYNTCENMLVCAPTGAGKTNIAMLAFLNLVKQNISDGMLDMGAVKAVYIAPMKALAQEVVTKFGERLKPLRMTVKEFTGKLIVALTMSFILYDVSLPYHIAACDDFTSSSSHAGCARVSTLYITRLCFESHD